MSPDRNIADPGNPRHIPGIFNYCDRWCERCPLPDRCPQYGEPTVSLHSIPGAARAQAAPDDWRDQAARDHPLMRAAHSYVDLVLWWLQTEREAVLAHTDDLVARAELGVDCEALLAEAAGVKQAFQTIDRDRWVIPSMLMRALAGHDRHPATGGVERDPVQNDSNGCAKVALISISRSEAAWRTLARWMGESATAALVADVLGQLRAKVVAEFPNASRFVRPGFDQIRD